MTQASRYSTQSSAKIVAQRTKAHGEGGDGASPCTRRCDAGICIVNRENEKRV
jgi:hypothetical protein